MKFELPKRWKTQSAERKNAKQYVWVYVLIAALTNFIVEVFSQGGLVQAFGYLTQRPLNFLYSTALIFLTMQLVFLVKRRLFAAFIVSIIWIILGAVNGIILSNRVTPFTYLDITLLQNTISMIHSYFSNFQIVLLCVAIGVLLLGLVFLFFKGPKRKRPIRYKWTLVGIGGYVVGFALATVLALQTGLIAIQFGNIATAYLEYGFPYCFVSTALNTGITRPINYSQQAVQRLDVSGEDLAEEGEEQKTPNIIMIQLESFFDPTLVEWLEFSEDPIPNYHALQEKYTSGYLNVPVVGAGTANTEFEILTGMSLQYFGTGEYPYKTILKKETCESIAYDLSDLGYSTHAMHNNEANFYGRNKVFRNLGFDTFTPMEYMNITGYTPNGWAKDECLTTEIIRTLQSTDNQDFIYAISVQGHGKYPDEQIDPDQTITVSGVEGERKAAIEYYVNQIHEMDAFVGELVDALSKQDEETVLVLYGDHLPSLDFQNADLKTNNIYQTEYIIWDNMGLEKQDDTVYTYQLTSKVADMLGIHHGTLINYHQKYKSTLNYQRNLKLLQYDMLYGKQYVYGGESPYKKVDTRYDVEDIVITDVYEDNGNLYVLGDAFTAHSRVTINGDRKDTVYKGRGMLMVEDYELKDGDEICIKQLSDSGKNVFSTSESFIYEAPPEPEEDSSESQEESVEEETSSQTEEPAAGEETPAEATPEQE
ncbi:MAG: LTA synthase family protein [Massiliimalia sp.]|jgi:phosphoglycerol transferase MdoB-like AlkP superfamily enzyme